MKSTILVLIALFVQIINASSPDIIIIGSGSAGSEVARILAKRSGIKITVIESGPYRPEKQYPLVGVPTLGYLLPVFRTEEAISVAVCGLAMTDTFRSLENKTSAGSADGCVPHFPSGGPGVSGLIWGKTQPELWDFWATTVNDTRFTNANMQSFMASSENVSYADSNSTLRGRNGPTQVTFFPFNDTRLWPYTEKLLQEFNVSQLRDYVAEGVVPGIYPLQRSIKRGSCTESSGPCVRSSPFFGTGGLEDIIKNTSSSVEYISEARVLKIVTRKDGNQLKVIGVDYLKGTETIRLRAKDAVVLSAGAINTPLVLMRSGIGPANHLEDIGIEVVLNNTHVGTKLQDKLYTLAAFWNPTGVPLSNPGTINIGFLNSGAHGNLNDVEFLETIVPNSYLQLELLAGIPDSVGHSILLAPVQLLNTSAGDGWVNPITSNPTNAINVSRTYDPARLGPLIWALRKMRSSMASLGLVELQPGSGLPITASDADYRKYLSKNFIPWQHPVGSCQMATKGSINGCVDTEFRFIGVNNLYVVDNSVLPVRNGFMPNTHPSWTATTIGGMAAQRIIDHLYT